MKDKLKIANKIIDRARSFKPKTLRDLMEELYNIEHGVYYEGDILKWVKTDNEYPKYLLDPPCDGYTTDFLMFSIGRDWETGARYFSIFIEDRAGNNGSLLFTDSKKFDFHIQIRPADVDIISALFKYTCLNYARLTLLNSIDDDWVHSLFCFLTGGLNKYGETMLNAKYEMTETYHKLERLVKLKLMEEDVIQYDELREHLIRIYGEY